MTATALTIETTKFGATVRALFDTPADAMAFAQRFPKSTKLAGTVNSHSLVNPGGPDTGIVKVFVKLAADGTNGGANETGLKRLATIRRVAARLGIEVIENRPPTPEGPDQPAGALCVSRQDWRCSRYLGQANAPSRYRRPDPPQTKHQWKCLCLSRRFGPPLHHQQSAIGFHRQFAR